MSHADLTLDSWLGLSDEAAARIAAAVAGEVGARLVTVAPRSYAGRSGRVAFFERDDTRYALVPGGTARLGYDADRLAATPRQLADFAEAAAEYDLAGPLQRHVGAVTSPPRDVELPARLVAVRSDFTDAVLEPDADDYDHAWVLAELERRGLRLPTPDEWEWACGAGATTLFRWGDEYPEGDPLVEEPNLFGLVIGDNPYNAELTTDPAVLCGGDGGAALCGGYGPFLAWLALATAYREADLADAVYQGYLLGETPMRPVIALD